MAILDKTIAANRLATGLGNAQENLDAGGLITPASYDAFKASGATAAGGYAGYLEQQKAGSSLVGGEILIPGFFDTPAETITPTTTSLEDRIKQAQNASTSDSRSERSAQVDALIKQANTPGITAAESENLNTLIRMLNEPTATELTRERNADDQAQVEAANINLATRTDEIKNNPGEAGAVAKGALGGLIAGQSRGATGAQTSSTSQKTELQKILGDKYVESAISSDPEINKLKNLIVEKTTGLVAAARASTTAEQKTAMANEIKQVNELNKILEEFQKTKDDAKKNTFDFVSKLSTESLAAMPDADLIQTFKEAGLSATMANGVKYAAQKVVEAKKAKDDIAVAQAQADLDKSKAELAGTFPQAPTATMQDFAFYNELSQTDPVKAEKFAQMKGISAKDETPKERADRMKTEAETKEINLKLGIEGTNAIYSTESLNSSIPTTGYTENANITRSSTVAMDTNNPGNITADSIPKGYTKESYAKLIGATGTYVRPGYTDKQGKFQPSREYFIFPDSGAGMQALANDISAKMSGATVTKLTGDSTILEYAQVHTGNHAMTASDSYVQALASATGLSTNSKIKDADPMKLAAGVAKAEGFVQKAISSGKNQLLYTQVFSLMGGVSKISGDEGAMIKTAIDALTRKGIMDPTTIADTLKTFVITNPENSDYAYNLMLTGLPNKDFNKSTLALFINNNKDGQAIQYVENNAMDAAKVDAKAVFGFKDGASKLDDLFNNKDYFNPDGTIKEGLTKYLGAYDSVENKYALKTVWGAKSGERQTAVNLAGDLASLMAAYRLQLSGTAVTESEGKYLEPLLAAVSDQPETIVTKLKAVKDNFTTSINTRRTSSGLPAVTDIGKFAKGDAEYMKSLYTDNNDIIVDPSADAENAVNTWGTETTATGNKFGLTTTKK